MPYPYTRLPSPIYYDYIHTYGKCVMYCICLMNFVAQEKSTNTISRMGVMLVVT